MAAAPTPDQRRFLVALSFPGEHRAFVEHVAECLADALGRDKVFYDTWHEHELNRKNLDLLLQKIYREQSLLVVPFFCKDYQQKKWCKVEWDAIRASIFARRQDDALMTFRFDATPIEGFQEIDGYSNINGRPPEAIAELILTRVRSMDGSGAKPQAAPPERGACIQNLPWASIGELFMGREGELAALAGEAAGAAAITQARAIQGMGGVGKTRLAVEIGWRAVQDGKHRSVLFAVAETPSGLLTNLAALAERLGLPERDASEDPVKVEAVLRWLESRDRWLLILDNADSEEAVLKVRGLLPRLSTGQVIITSRQLGWGADVQSVDLPALSEDAAAAFLLKRTERRPATPNDDADARSLARELDGLPLALEIAGAWIKQTRCTLADYLSDWNARREKVLARLDLTNPDVPKSVALTWNKTFETLTPAARALLRLAAWLAPEPIPLGLFERHGDRLAEAAALMTDEMPASDPTPVAPLAAPNVGLDFREALGELARYSMADRDADAFEVHRLVQEAVRLGIAPDRRRAWLECCLGLVNNDCKEDPPANDVRSWPWWNPMASHVKVIADRADAAKIAEPTAWLMNNLGIYLDAKALYVEAEPLFRRALAIREKSYGPDHPAVAVPLNNLAMLLKNTNRLAEAEPLFRRALAINEKSFGPDHPKVATDLNNLASLFIDTNRLAKAEPLFRRALAIDEKCYGPDHPEVATDLNNLAMLLQATNRLAEAEPLCRRACRIRLDSLGADHPDTRTGMKNYARLLEKLGRPWPPDLPRPE
jgi:tetratricopeptide (TPR) repeat protein